MLGVGQLRQNGGGRVGGRLALPGPPPPLMHFRSLNPAAALAQLWPAFPCSPCQVAELEEQVASLQAQLEVERAARAAAPVMPLLPPVAMPQVGASWGCPVGLRMRRSVPGAAVCSCTQRTGVLARQCCADADVLGWPSCCCHVHAVVHCLLCSTNAHCHCRPAGWQRGHAPGAVRL